MTSSKKQHHFLKLFLFICLILTGLLIPIFYKDVGCEFVYGGGNWNPLQSKILFQGFEDNGVDQTKQALVNDGWKSFEAGFSPSEKESEMIYGYELPEGFKAGQLHVLTKRYGDNGYVKVSVSSDQKHWKVLIEDGRDWRLQRSEGKKTEEWVEGKHDVGIPGKYLKDKLYIKFSGACQTGNDWVSVDQWGVKVWKKQSLMGMMRDGIQNIRENTWKEGSRGRWINNRLRYRYHNVADETKVICEDGGEDLRKTVDGSPLTTRPVAIPENHQHQATMVFDFGKPRAIGKIGIFFWGDLHRATSYHATEYKIEGLCNGEWLTIGEEKDNREPLVTHYVNAKYQVTQVRVTFTKAFLDHMVQVGEVYLYEREKVSLIKGIGHFLSQYNKSLPASFLYTLLFLAMLFFPGYCIAQAFPERVLDEEDKFVFSFLFSVILYGLISISGLATGLFKIFYLIIPFSVGSFLLFFCKGWYKKLRKLDGILLGLLPLILFFCNAYQYHRDMIFSLPHIENYLDTLTIPPMSYYGYHPDNLLQWRIAKVFLHQMELISPQTVSFMGGYGYNPELAIFERTPLLPLLNVPFLYLFGESHFIYERLLTLFAVLFLLPVHVLVRHAFSSKIARMTSWALLLNNFFFFLSGNVEVYFKYFSVYPLVLGLSLLLKYGIKNRFVNALTGLSYGVGYFIHCSMFFVYLPATLIYTYVIDKKHLLKFACFLLLGVILFALPWKAFTYREYFKKYGSMKIADRSLNYLSSSKQQGLRQHIHERWTKIKEIFNPFRNESMYYIGNKEGLVKTISCVIFLYFILGALFYYQKIKHLLIFIFIPPLSIALLTSEWGPAMTSFGYYLSIPLTLASVFYFTSRIKVITTVAVVYYLLHNLSMSLDYGYFFALQGRQQISAQMMGLIGMFLYVAYVIYGALKTAIRMDKVQEDFGN